MLTERKDASDNKISTSEEKENLLHDMYIYLHHSFGL